MKVTKNQYRLIRIIVSSVESNEARGLEKFNIDTFARFAKQAVYDVLLYNRGTLNHQIECIYNNFINNRYKVIIKSF